MKKVYSILAALLLSGAGAQAQERAYKRAPETPGANYFTVVAEERARLETKRKAYLDAHPGQPISQALREEIAHFERWAYNWRDRVDAQGRFPSASQGWINSLQKSPKAFDAKSLAAVSKTTNVPVWTNIGPLDSAISNGWTYGAGIGRINTIRRVPGTSILLAGSAAGGIFRSTNMGAAWTPVSDNLAGLGISDIAIDPANPSVMYAATGDWDAKHMNSIGVYKSTDGGLSWNATGLAFTLSQGEVIAHIAVDPANSNIVMATCKDAIWQSTDAGATWAEFYKVGSNYFFNDIIKIGAAWWACDKYGTIYKSNPAGTQLNDRFTNVLDNGRNERLDFAWTPANPDTLYLLTATNPAFAKFSVVTNTATTYTNVTNANPSDGNANYNTQQGYNQVIAVSPTNKDSIWVGEFSGGKLSTDGGATWTNKLNGYYDPTSSSANWGGFYVHSDQHDFVFAGSDTLLIGNDGGAYVGKISTNNFQQRFNGLVTTQSYSMALFEPSPSNLMLGNQDNDGSSRVSDGSAYKFYGAQAGDGTATAIHRTDSTIRYVGGTNGSLSYRSDAYKTSAFGSPITTPSGGPFVWDLQMHSTDGSILYGGFGDLNKMTGAPTGTWTALNAGAGQIRSITLADNNATTQKIIVIGSNNTVRKSADESTWSTITPPAGVTFNSMYATKSNWDTLFATAPGYTAANKIFMSINNGATWTNITKNFPNIVAKKIVRLEGSDTLFVATEIGVYSATIGNAMNQASPWAAFGTGLPNVRIEDMEISTAQRMLFVSSFGRGVWSVPLALSVPLPTPQTFAFGHYTRDRKSFLRWNIEADGVERTVLERSKDGNSYAQLAAFAGVNGLTQEAFPVEAEGATTYYRLHTLNAAGVKTYSQTVMIDATGAVQTVSVYPNPTNGHLHIVSGASLQMVQIFSVTGQQVAFARPGSQQYSFDMGLLPRGTYIVQLTDAAGAMSRHTVVRK